MHRYSIEDIRRAVYPPSFERGVAYQRSNRVDQIKIAQDGRLITGLVKGDARDPYKVQVHISGRDNNTAVIHGACTCSTQTNCKHVAALLLHALESEGEEPSEEAPNTEEPTATESVFESWVERLQTALSTTAAPAATAAQKSTDQIAYLLTLDSKLAQPRLTVHAVVVRRLKSGGYGKAQPFSGSSNARYVTPQDRTLLQWIAGLTENTESGPSISGRQGAFLLRELLATGRCHWESKDSPPLKPGARRDADFSWEMFANGEQRLQCIGTRISAVLPVEPPWYVALDTHECGPLTTEYPPAVAAQLAQAPTITVEQANLLSERFADPSVATRLPTPLTFEQIEDKKITPTPCLRLFLQSIPVRREHRWEFDANEVQVELAHLSFDYDGIVTDLNDTRRALVRAVDGALIRIHRDYTAEQHALQTLDEWHWSPLEMQVAFSVPPAHVNHLTMHGTERQEQLKEFSLKAVQQLRAQGWRIEMTPDYPYRIVENIGEWYANIGTTGIDATADVDIGVTLDGQRVSLLPVIGNLMRRAKYSSSYQRESGVSVVVHLDDGRLLALPRARVDALLAAVEDLFQPAAKRGMSDRIRVDRTHAAQLNQLEQALGDQARWEGGNDLREIGHRLHDFRGIEEVPPPPGLHATLREYQQQGLNWLQFLRSYDLGGILADDMGLGKTVQALAHLLVEKTSGRMTKPSMVIAPTSLMVNWQMEAQKFAPELRVLVLHGDQRRKKFDEVDHCDLILTTYPLLLRDQAALLKHEYHMLILDEAQHIKNARTKASAIVRTIRARYRLCLTGTPMENHLGELWSLFDFLMPGLLGDEKRFQRQFRDPIEKNGDVDRQHDLNRRVTPFMLRRKKSEVARELPPKTEILKTVALANGQRDLYDAIRLAVFERVREEVGTKGLARSNIVILDALLKLRQVCCDPKLVNSESVQELAKTAGSAKLELLMDLVPSQVEEGRRILLFSQFTSMLALIEEQLRAANIPFVTLTGDTRDRGTPIQQFQNGEVPVFLISLRAGGTGLNLTAADTVIHYDPWWNPAVENQATDRAYRIGQDKPVFVYKLVTAGTVEEKILDLQARKQALADGLFADGGEGITALTEEDLSALFAPL